jgi:hypothetical protein
MFSRHFVVTPWRNKPQRHARLCSCRSIVTVNKQIFKKQKVLEDLALNLSLFVWLDELSVTAIMNRHWANSQADSSLCWVTKYVQIWPKHFIAFTNWSDVEMRSTRNVAEMVSELPTKHVVPFKLWPNTMPSAFVCLVQPDIRSSESC